MFDYDFENPDIDRAFAHVESLLTTALHDHYVLEEVHRDLYDVATCIDYFCDGITLSTEEEEKLAQLTANMQTIYARLDAARKDPRIYELALDDARERILRGEPTAGREDLVLFGFVSRMIVDPAVLALVARPLPEALEGACSDGFRLVQAPRWVYDIITEELDASNWHGRVQYTPAVPVPTDLQAELLARMTSLLDLASAANVASALAL